MAGLFKKKLLQQKLADYTIPDFDEKLALVQQWYEAQTKGILVKKTETECEQAFNDDFFKTVLGYASFPSNPYTIDPKGKTQATGQKPDAILGYYDPEGENTHKKTQVVVEIKDAKTLLDKSQRREGNLSPIQQGFKYKPQYTNCKWVIATNFIEIRLFKDNQLDYELWTLADLVNSDNDYYQFKRFHYLLNASNLISKDDQSHTEKLLTEVRIEQEAITKSFYADYKQLRHRLIQDLLKRNKKISILTIVSKAQKIIDRLIFVHFCEDLGLLPEGKLATNVTKAREVGFTPWEMLKKFFHLIDKGSDKLEIPDGYNGGLFAPDGMLDGLVVGDQICEEFIDLGKYDFSEDLSVNILGHIFEQSISDLEEMRSSLLEGVGSSKAKDAKQSKRKKDGIFYTPEYIVDYIVKHSLGTRLEEQFETLKEKKFKQSKKMKDSTFHAKEKELYAEYQQILQNVKVLDPACGSGAFLVKVFDYLLEENVRVMNVLSDGQDGLFDPYSIAKGILTNNIYGVDLNEESVEISKLSLRLKTAEKGKKLADLDDNIKCGNSLIDDPEIAGEKAFKWEEEFAEIMSTGGFDVVVGNPPYVQFQKLDPITRSCLRENEQYESQSDLRYYFVYLAHDILVEGGVAAFITSNYFLTSTHAKTLRGFIIDKFLIKEILDFEEKEVFPGVGVHSIIFCLEKEKKTNGNIFQYKTIVGDLGMSENYKSISINQETLDNTRHFLDQESVEILHKITKSNHKLGEICKIGTGIKTGADKIFVLDQEKVFEKDIEKEPLRRRIKNSDINRYYVKKSNQYVIYADSAFSINDYPNISKHIRQHQELLSDKRKKRGEKTEYYKLYRAREDLFPRAKEIIICPYKAHKNRFMIVDDVVGSGDIYVIIPQLIDYSIEYLLVLLNSCLYNWIYSKVGKKKAGMFEYYTEPLSKLPIKKIPSKEQQLFVDRAKHMINLHNILNEQAQRAWLLLQERYSLKKDKAKLQSFCGLVFSDFKKQLKVKKLSLEDEEELLSYFTKKKTQLLELKAQIDATDREIDEMVFDLYGLTDEERKIVLDGSK